VTAFDWCCIAAVLLLVAGLAWLERILRRADARIEAKACVRHFRRSSLGPYPERRPGPGRLRRGRAYRHRLITEIEAQLRAAARKTP
jgi:hypothetical protein